MLQFRRRQLLSCQRVTAANSYSSKAVGAKGTPRFRPPRLGPWPFTISVVNLFGGNFVWVLWLAHPVRSVFAATPLEDSMPSDHDSANAPATASSVYVIAHPAAGPTHYAPRSGGYCAQPLRFKSHGKQGTPLIQAGARSTRRGLRVGVVVSFGILEPKISRFAARLMREAPRY